MSREPRQVRKEAAVSGSHRATQGDLIRVGTSGMLAIDPENGVRDRMASHHPCTQYGTAASRTTFPA